MTVDGTLDNVAAVERVGGDPVVEAQAMLLREAGWAAIRHHPEAQRDSGWPPRHAEVRIDLSTSDVEFIKKALDDSQQVTLQILAESDLHPSVRQEQEEDLAAGDDAVRFWRSLTDL
jgi:hypothetical protein